MPRPGVHPAQGLDQLWPLGVWREVPRDRPAGDTSNIVTFLGVGSLAACCAAGLDGEATTSPGSASWVSVHTHDHDTTQ